VTDTWLRHTKFSPGFSEVSRNDEDYSNSEVKPLPGSDLYYAGLYLPPAVRHEIHVLEAGRRTVARIPQNCSDRGVAHVKLAWWRDEFERLNHASPRHEITLSLAPLAKANPELADMYIELVERVAESLAEPLLHSRADVMAAIRSLYGDIFRHIVLRGGVCELDTTDRLIDLACCIERAYELNDLRQHRRGSLLFLSHDVLSRYALTVDRVRHAANSTEIHDLLIDEFDDAGQALETACTGLSRSVRRQQRMLCTLAYILRRVLQLTVDDGCRVLEQRIELTPVHKLWIAWRTRWFG
jgi:15-cis-phytoene synthase